MKLISTLECWAMKYYNWILKKNTSHMSFASQYSSNCTMISVYCFSMANSVNYKRDDKNNPLQKNLPYKRSEANMMIRKTIPQLKTNQSKESIICQSCKSTHHLISRVTVINKCSSTIAFCWIWMRKNVYVFCRRVCKWVCVKACVCMVAFLCGCIHVIFYWISALINYLQHNYLQYKINVSSFCKLISRVTIKDHMYTPTQKSYHAHASLHTNSLTHTPTKHINIFPHPYSAKCNCWRTLIDNSDSRYQMMSRLTRLTYDRLFWLICFQLRNSFPYHHVCFWSFVRKVLL
jgi:hypothetical protein